MTKTTREAIYPAWGPPLWYLNIFGMDGVTMPWKRIYIRKEHIYDAGLREHELVHLEQIERHGSLKFWFLYFWWMIWFGYEKHPFEEEAYGRQFARQHHQDRPETPQEGRPAPDNGCSDRT